MQNGLWFEHFKTHAHILHLLVSILGLAHDPSMSHPPPVALYWTAVLHSAQPNRSELKPLLLYMVATEQHALIIVADTQATQFRLQICRISLCAREISSKSKCPRGADASRAFTEKRKAAFLRFRLHKAAIAWTALFAWPDHAGKPNTQLKRFHRMAERPRLVCFHIKGRLGKNRLIGRSITKTDADAHVCASPFLSQTCACPFNTLEQIYQL